MKSKTKKPEPVLTPYAVLLVKPTDDDDAIRREYHALARKQHPDLRKSREPGPLWQVVNEAYALIESVKLRTTWHKVTNMKSGICVKCHGFGVTGSRIAGGRIKMCTDCSGCGRA